MTDDLKPGVHGTIPERTAAHTPDRQLPGDISLPTPDHTTDRPLSGVQPPGTLPQSPEYAASLWPAFNDSAAPAVPGYEILGELGRGGMGVVYKARDVNLNRTVALKMVLDGRTGRNELIRFLAEAEAVAAIKHPNVVQVYEYGEHDGHPFMALEYLMGGTLGTARSQIRRQPTAVAQLVGKVAQGVAAAHVLGIVHRDLKPANILLDETGVPKVTDFGLAKRGVGTDLTATRVVMGTPTYMSPEQAKGDTKFVGPQADVWALGVILYEALTGERPFHADGVQQILSRILTADPVPPRKLLPSIPRDLELICLKCLSKEPHERYPTARELADDIDRFLRNEPISVRPAGPVERVAKWVKRNKVVAGAMTAVALALVVGSAVSIAFGLDAKEKETLANGEAARAEREAATATRERNDAIIARNDLAKEKEKLSQSRDWLAQSSARSILRPLGLLDPRSERTVLPLTGPEIDALWDLAAAPEAELRRRFIAEALRETATTRQLKNSATYSIHAAVGLDGNQRQVVEDLLVGRLAAADSSSEQRLALLLTLSRLDGLSPRASADSGRALLAAADKQTINSFVPMLSVFVRRAEAADAAEMVSIAFADPTINRYNSSELELLLAATARMTPEEAKTLYKTAAGHILTKLTVEKEAVTANGLCMSLIRVATLLDPRQESELCRLGAAILGFKMASTTQPFILQIWAGGLTRLAEHIEPAAGAAVRSQVAATLVRALVNSVDPQLTESLARDLVRAVTYLERDEAKRVCGQAGRTLTTAMRRTSGDGLAKVASGLAVLAPHMDPAEAAAACGQAAPLLVSAALKTTDPFVLPSLTGALKRIAPYLTPADASTTATGLATVMKTKTDHGTLQWLTEAFAALVVRAGPDGTGVRRQAIDHLTEVMGKARDSIALGSVAGRLSDVLEGMDPAEAAIACKQAIATLSQSIENSSDPYMLRSAGRGLAGLAIRVDRETAAEACRPAVAKLLQILLKLPTSRGVGDVGDGLLALTENLDPKEVADKLLPALTQTGISWALSPLSRCLLATTNRMDPKTATATLVRAMRAIPTGTSGYSISIFSQSLTAVAGRLETGEATELAAVLRRAVTELTDPEQLKGMATALAAIAGRLPREEAANACRPAAVAITRAMGKTKSSAALKSLALGLAAVAEHLPAAEAETACGKGASVLLPILTTTIDVSTINSLSEALGSLARRMGSKEARESAVVLTRAMTKITSGFALRSLVDGLSSVAHKCDPEEAADLRAEAAAILIEIASRYPETRDVEALGACLVTILSGPPPDELSRRSTTAVTVIGSAVANGPLVAAPLPTVSDPLLCQLSTQQLVELLKHPCCRNESCRVILRLLEDRYRHRFADPFDFVPVAAKHAPGLDFVTPPKRRAVNP